ncbi:hypothetical protein GW17_00040950 [Ensete ventricosum]|nr:hypothetical protein GW17_00040950 [Ensete ventricosum]
MDDESNGDHREEGEPAVFQGTDYSPLHSTIAFCLSFGGLHFILALVLAAVFLLPARLAAASVPAFPYSFNGLQNLERVHDRFLFSKDNLFIYLVVTKILRYIGKYVAGYFPITVHVEDIKAFDPDQAYGELFFIFFVFYTPILRHIWTWLGVVPASRKNFYAYLEAGYSCLIVPGGVQEMFYMNNFSEVCLLHLNY